MNTIKSIAALVTAAISVAAFAYTAPVETMTIEKNDGTTQVFRIDDVNRIFFDMGEEEVNFLITDGDNVLYKADNIDPLFRFAPDADSSISLVFGTVAGASGLEELKNGRYVVIAEIAPEVLSQTLDLGKDTPEVSVRILEYANGQLTATHGNVTAGSISASVNNKTKKVTLTLEAAFDNGLDIKAYCSSIPVEIEGTDVLFPEEQASNNVLYHNASGTLSKTINIESVEKKLSGSGMTVYTIKFGGDDEYTKCKIELMPDFVGKDINFAAYTETNQGAPYFTFQYEHIQVASPNGQWRNQGIDGTMSVVEEGETIRIKADVTNRYYTPTSPGTTAGTPERVVIDYKGAFVQK